MNFSLIYTTAPPNEGAEKDQQSEGNTEENGVVASEHPGSEEESKNTGDQSAKTENKDSSWFGNIPGVGAVKNAVDFVSELGNVKKFINSIIFFIMKGAIGAVAWLCGFVIAFMCIARKFLLVVGGALLPIFIAGISTQSFRTQSINYLFGLIGIALWPLGWSLGHIITGELMSWFADATSSVLLLPLKIGYASFEKAHTASAVTAFAISGGAVAAAASVFALSSLIMLLVGIVAVSIWVILVTFSCPLLVQRLVTSGSHLFTSLLQGYAQTSVGMAGEIANAALVGVGGVAGGGSGLGAGAAMRGAAGSSENGGVFTGRDSGIDMEQGGFVGTASNHRNSASQGETPVGQHGPSTPVESARRAVMQMEEQRASNDAHPSNAMHSMSNESPLQSSRGGSKVAQAIKGGLLGAGFALSRTAINASRWDGDPSRFAPVVDFGFDEQRQYRMQNQIGNRDPNVIKQAASEAMRQPK